MEASPKVVSREKLLEELWDDQSFVDENTLNVNMTRVRKKLADYEIKSSIETVRGAGYRFIIGTGGIMKKFTLFLKEHVSFLIFQVILILFILFLYWLDGFRNFNTAIYSISMSMLLTSGYLCREIHHEAFILRSNYAKARKDGRCTYPIMHKHQSIGKRQTFTRELYRLYQNEVQTLYAAQHRQLQFMNQWVHQMKTPISVMGLLLQEEDELDRDSITEEVEKIRRGLDSVLVNARLETFEQDMQIERVGLKKLVQEIVTEHKRLFITNGVFPVISIDDNFLVATDVKWMKIVIGQFITNAVKYTFDEGKKVHLTATCTENGLAIDDSR